MAYVVKKAALAAGLDPERLSGHSLRAGFVTSAVRAGVSTPKIQHQAGHKSPGMIAVYTRMESAWDDNTALDLTEMEE